MNVKSTFFVILLSTVTLTLTQAQNSHHWTQQYGNKSLLLGGAVTGSVSDLGAVYYNPGFLALQKNKSSFIITAKLLQFTNLQLDNGLGDDIDLDKNSLGNSAGLVAGTFKLKFLPKSTFAYSFLTRKTHNIDLVHKSQSNVDIIPDSPGEEVFTSNIVLQYESTEVYAGWSWSYVLNEHLGVGISNFMSTAYTNSLFNIDLVAMTQDQQVIPFNTIRQFDYINFGMIWKLGFAIQYPKFSAGINITAPKINIAGSGFMYSQRVFSGLDSNDPSGNEDYFESDYQKNLPAKLKSPFSVAVGTGLNFNKINLNLSAEWFHSVSKYTVMKPEPFIGQSTGEPVINNIVDELVSVVNTGIGLKYDLNDNYDLYVGFSTDFSAASPDSKKFTDLNEEIYNSSMKANMYNFSGGTVFEFNRIYLTLGMAYNYGIDYIQTPVNLPTSSNNEVFDPNEQSTLKINTWKLLLGFAIKPSKK